MLCAKNPKQRASLEAIYEVCQECHTGGGAGPTRLQIRNCGYWFSRPSLS